MVNAPETTSSRRVMAVSSVAATGTRGFRS